MINIINQSQESLGQMESGCGSEEPTTHSTGGVLLPPQVTSTPLLEDEVETGLIVRPELFHRPSVSGLTLPVTVRDRSGIRQKWSLYLRHGSGRREFLDLKADMILADGQQLIFSLQPGIPDAANCPWTQSARIAWLSGYDPDPAQTYLQLAELVRSFVMFPEDRNEGTLATVSLWIIMSYLYPIWPSVPYLSVGGPAGSGKSRLFEVLAELVFRPLGSSNMTAPCLFRTLHQRGGTLLLDEAERLKDRSAEAGELRSILLAGYKANGKAHRLTGEEFATRAFDVFGPKALACIAGLPEALVTRCIPITMFRAASDSPIVHRRMSDYQSQFQSVRNDLHAMALSYGQDVLTSSGQLFSPEGLTARDCEIWQPLIDLARFIETSGVAGITDLVLEFAVRLAESVRDDAVPECDEVVLQSLSRLLPSSPMGITAKTILDDTKKYHFNLMANFSPKGVGAILSRYGIRSIKTGGKRVFRPTEVELQTIQQSYGIDLGFPGENDANVSGPFSESTWGTSGTLGTLQEARHA